MTNSTPSTPVVPSEVGWQFVPQYYTFVNKQPDRLHCFYTKASTFIHGTEGEEGSPCFGQQEIHNKITSIGFEDCKVFIHSVDAQSSANGGIIIQVIGEMSNHGEPWRKFAQTFFLAEQPNGYFVLNDIFRFLKEETVDSDDDAVPETPAPVPAVAVPAAAAAAADAPADAPAAAAPVPEEPTQPPSPPPAAPSPPPAVVEEAPVDVPEPAVAAPPTPEPVPNGVSTPEPEKPATPEPEPAPPVAAPAPAPAPSKPATPAPAPAAPKTWASLAASNSNRWGANVAQESRGVTESPITAAAPAAAPVPAQQPPAPRQPQPQQQQPQQQHHHHHQHGGSTPTYGPIAAASITTAHCFVKGIIDPITQPLLTSTLAARFGPLKEIEIVRSKACAFIEFQSIESARRAISQSPFWIDVGADGPQLRISVETKKERGERPPSRPRGGAPVNGGAGPGEGRGGWKRGAPRGRGAPVAK
ncbi:hypothetical protein C0989_009228 [Termitomyces sp. Mn162]|nr:hypothetical protein C0989_009228 [Termitomyces sp. Mn162]KAH0581397.1 hypothetical protein H2248_012482 [Termitomyces sp. 'cryptogamus']